jgi:phage nucleotide-binding protein
LATATKEAPLAERIGAVSADRAIGWFNLLIYGDYGAGKTYFASTAQDHPSTTPVLFLDIEGGTATIRKRPEIEVVQVRSINQLVSIYDELEADQGKTYRTVIIDSVSELQKLDLADIMREVVREHSDRDVDVPAQREYGKSTAHMRKIVRAFRDLPCNTIFTSLAKRDQDESTGKVTYVPNLTGKLAAEVPAFLDTVGYLYTVVEKDRIERRLVIGNHPKYRGKDRLQLEDQFGPIIENPNVPMIWNALAA